jgi:hypothetical protein
MRFVLGLIAALALAVPARAATVIDHIQLAASDLAAATADVAARTGVAPKPGGVHPGRGTANALMSLGPRTYLEVIAPAPGQPATTPMARSLAATRGLSVRTFAVASADLDAIAAAARRAGLTAEGPAPGSRQTPGGQLLRWRSLEIGGHGFGEFVPFFIDWGDTPHPAITSPAGVRLEGLRVVHPKAVELKRIYAALGLDVPVEAGPQARFVMTLAGPKGRVAYTTQAP